MRMVIRHDSVFELVVIVNLTSIVTLIVPRLLNPFQQLP